MEQTIHSNVHFTRDTPTGLLKNWWILLILGVVFLAAGFFTIFYPVHSYAALTILFSVTFFVNGILESTYAIINRDSLTAWGWRLTGGIIDFVLGLFLMAFPIIAAAALPYFVGFWMLYRGTVLTAISFDLKSLGMPRWGWVLVLGILGILFSFLLIFNPAIGVGTVILWTALGFMSAGVYNIIVGFQCRSANKWNKKQAA